MVIFTRYVDTMEYLEEQIQEDAQYANATVLIIYGRLSEQRRREIFRAFERAERWCWWPPMPSPRAFRLRDLSGLLDVQPSEQTRTAESSAEGEVQEALSDALAIKGLDDLLENAVETRRRELVTERERMKRPVRSSQPGEWLEGIDDLAPGSFDLLTVTVLFPA